jgi:creatinine amidohydrolase
VNIDRWYGRLTAPDITTRLSSTTVLCLPIGSYEQHGPHLPLHTDTTIAEEFARRLLDRHGDTHDLVNLPSIPYGLSLEHAWSPGTISLTSSVFTALLDTVVGEYVRATPARKLLIVNGHGGNRGILEAAVYELRRTYRINVCVVHPSPLSTVRVESALPEIHAGTRETSVMLALAPDDVHLDRLPADYTVDNGQRAHIRRLVLDRGTTWPWTSNDPQISQHGLVGGDPRDATAELGESIISSALDACATVFDHFTATDP